MSIFKCKMCGGTIEFNPGDTVGVCDSCGTKQTLPRLDDDKKVNLYDRANYFRRNNEFDKAMAIYEQILLEDNTDAEAYWSLVLCRYGIEYVEDPTTHKRVPTVNRAQFTSIFADGDYKLALQYADGYQKEIYEQEAKVIDEIQKGILEISSKEEPFDVFICYKETDNNGRRTQDSVLATDLYHQLTQEGFKVFFSRITLEDKIGTAYEPYIFAALNSAKVMVVLGTKPEYFTAAWVKNEWSRYLALVKQSNGKKMLIPAYWNMNPYDLPEEFSHLQAQDMSKLGFMQDLIRGIKKIIDPIESQSVEKTNAIKNDKINSIEPLLKRTFMFLEDENFSEANEYCEKILDQDPECSQAYLGKLMVDLKVNVPEALAYCNESFEDNSNYLKIIRFGDAGLIAQLKHYISHIKERNETIRLMRLYNDAVKLSETAKTEKEWLEVAKNFENIHEFRDADSLREKCLEKAEICRKDAIYDTAKAKMTGNNIEIYKKAILEFQTIPGWKDSDEQILKSQGEIEQIKKRKEKAAKNRKRAIIIATPIICVSIAFLIVLKIVIMPSVNYKQALSLLKKGEIIEAYEKLEKLGDYKDSKERASKILYSYEREKLKKASVGDVILFGSYEQDNDEKNGKEGIEWIVIDKKKDRVLVISKKILDFQKYNKETDYTGTTWEDCTLRQWLNQEFKSNAFSSEEEVQIRTTYVEAEKNPKVYDSEPGNNTDDKIFLLSINEANSYFKSDSKRKCEVTEYFIEQYNKQYAADFKWEEDNFYDWFLRTPGKYQWELAKVQSNGEIDYENSTTTEISGIRPAMWINIKDSEDEANRYLGTWKAVKATYNGYTISVKDEIGNIEIVLLENGKCTLTYGGESENGTWSEIAGGVKVTDAENTTVEMKEQDGYIVMSEDGIEIFFERE